MKNVNVIQIKPFSRSFLKRGRMFILGLFFFVNSMTSVFANPPAGAFVTVWNTDGVTSISFQINNSNRSTAYYWEEINGGSSNSGTGLSFSANNSTQTVTISSLPNATGAKIRLFIAPEISYFRANSNSFGSRLLEVSAWGIAQWSSMNLSFQNCSNMQITATDVPDLANCTLMSRTFQGCSSFTGGNLNEWTSAVSKITHMEYLFASCSNFNVDISSWNVSNVVNMNYVFFNASVFNQDLSSWCVPKIETNPTAFSDGTNNWSKTNRFPLWGACRVWNGSTSIDFSEADNWENLRTGSTLKKVPDNSVKIIYIKSDANRDISIGSHVDFDIIRFLHPNHKIILGNFDLKAKQVINADNKLRFQTNGTGQLVADIAHNAAFTFHVGNGAYNPLTITNNTNTADEFKVRVVNEIKTNGLTGKNLPSDMSRVERVWVINKGNSSANAGNGVNLSFGWAPSHEVAPTHSNTGFYVAVLNKYNTASSTWETVTGNNVYNEGTQTFTFNEYKGTFSNFAIGGSASALPVNYASFEVAAIVGSHPFAKISWATNFEVNADHFNIQRSNDGINWNTIGHLGAHGNTYEMSDYVFYDENPEPVNYYRLQQVDMDGTSDFSKTKMLVFKNQHSLPNVTRIYPNPSNGNINIQSDHHALTDYQLFNMNGQLMHKGTFSGKEWVKNLPVGIYKLIVNHSDTFETHTIIVQ